MTITRLRLVLAFGLLLALHGATAGASSAADTLRYWNTVAVDASGIDHTPPAPGEDRVFAEQLGPGRASRAMAIVHIAMFDAVNAIIGHGYQSYTGIDPAPRSASVNAAIAQAAHDTLVAVFPAQRERLHDLLVENLKQNRRDLSAHRQGRQVGRRAAAAILELRRKDGSRKPEPLMGTEWITSEEPGHWRQDPISLIPIALGAQWGKVRPFVMRSGKQFRTLPPMASEAYTRAFNEAKAYGGDGVTTQTVRSDEQTQIGIYWAYDGTPTLCAPPRLYNQILETVSARRTSVIKLARLYALANVAIADAGIAIWESKYHYDFWRQGRGVWADR